MTVPKNLPAKIAANDASIDFDHHLPSMLGRISNRLEAYASNTYIRKFGLGLRGWKIITAIGSDGPLTVNEIAEVHGTVQSSISRAVQDLVKQGFVKKTKSPTDGRSVVVTITKKGKKIHDAMVPLSLRRAEELMKAFSPRDRRKFESLLELLQNKLDEMVAIDWDSKALKALSKTSGGKTG